MDYNNLKDAPQGPCFEHFYFRHLNLFSISDSVLRIFFILAIILL
jgi:hypothetical protein